MQKRVRRECDVGMSQGYLVFMCCRHIFFQEEKKCGNNNVCNAVNQFALSRSVFANFFMSPTFLKKYIKSNKMFLKQT